MRLLLTLAAVLLTVQSASAQDGSAILQDLRSFRTMGTVLHVGAHPDDENTQLITYLARGRGYRTAYLSMTRGDGGQNLLGPQFGEKLGVARTQELLAARRLDLGRQFFTRALDFGFSKDYAETLNVWDRQQVLSDVVRVIRTFRPDVIVTRFSPEPGGTHGHHTASAVLALEAFKLAADPQAFPEQLRTLGRWQPKRILQNVGTTGGRGNATPSLRIDVSGTDPVLGESYAAIAGRSRAQHITQGFGNAGTGGGGPAGPRYEGFLLLDGAPATQDIMDGIDTTWARVPNGAAVGALADSAIAQFDAKNPSASVPLLLRLRTRVAAVPRDPVIDDKRVLLDRILQSALGLEVSTTIPEAEVVPGEALKLEHTVKLSAAVPVRWLRVRYPLTTHQTNTATALQANQPATQTAIDTLPFTTPPTQPYWLREEGTAGMFRVSDAQLIGRPENPPAFPVEHVFEVGGQTLVIADEPVQLLTRAGAAARRKLDVIAPVAVSFPTEVRLFAPGSSRKVEVTVKALRAGSRGTVQLNVPAGWKFSPATQSFRLATLNDSVRIAFDVTAPAKPATVPITVTALVGGKRYNTQRVVIDYPHIPLQMLQPRARLKAVSVSLATRGRNIGYLPGAGDDVPRSLTEMGYNVSEISGADLTPEKLRSFDAVVVGIRALNVREDLAGRLPALFSYVEGGGNVIMQYNTTSGLQVPAVAPYPLRISQDRVTDERAVPTLLAPEHAALNSPNRITSGDFDGWVQERGLYFPNEWDAHFTPIVGFSDPGEAMTKGGLLVTQHGRGYFVYTGLGFFRQLPAGVAGAYKLFANLLALGKVIS